MSVNIDITANRRKRAWSWQANAARLAWWCVQPLFRYSPRPLWQWRVALLRLFGATVGRDAHIYPSVRIAMPWHLTLGDQAAVGENAQLYALGQIRIGAQATVSQNAHLCAGTHDWRDPTRRLLTPPITIGEGAWVCADAFVGPGVRIGAFAVLGARGVAMRDVPQQAIAIGNPAKVVGSTD